MSTSTYFLFSSSLFFVLFILNLADYTYMVSLQILNAGCLPVYLNVHSVMLVLLLKKMIITFYTTVDDCV